MHAVNQAKANLGSAPTKVVQQDAGVRNAASPTRSMRALIEDRVRVSQDLDTAPGQLRRGGGVSRQTHCARQVKQMEVAQAQAEDESGLFVVFGAPLPATWPNGISTLVPMLERGHRHTSTMSRGILSLHDVDTVRR